MPKNAKQKGRQNSKEDKVLSALADLSSAVGSGFQKVHEELAEIRTDLYSARSDIEAMKRGIDDLKERVIKIEARILDNHESRLAMLEAKLLA